MTLHDWLILLGIPTSIILGTAIMIGATWLAAKRSVAKTPNGPPQFWAVPDPQKKRLPRQRTVTEAELANACEFLSGVGPAAICAGLSLDEVMVLASRVPIEERHNAPASDERAARAVARLGSGTKGDS